MQVQSVCPILAPVIGAYLLLHVQWQGIFWILAVCGGLGALAVWLMVPETGKQNETGNNDFGNAVKRLIGCRRYWLMTLSFASLMGALFSYIGSSSFIYVTLFQASATEFSLYFGLNSLGVIAFGLVSVRMLRVMPLKRAFERVLLVGSGFVYRIGEQDRKHRLALFCGGVSRAFVWRSYV